MTCGKSIVSRARFGSITYLRRRISVLIDCCKSSFCAEQQHFCRIVRHERSMRMTCLGFQLGIVVCRICRCIELLIDSNSTSVLKPCRGGVSEIVHSYTACTCAYLYIDLCSLIIHVCCTFVYNALSHSYACSYDVYRQCVCSYLKL